MADRFHCPGPWRDGLARLDGDEARHLARVMRVGVGETVTLFDGVGRVASAVVVEIGKDRVDLRIGPDRPGRELPGSLVLATAVPKGDRFDWLVEKATEIGVGRLIPLRTARSVVDPRPSKLDRLRKVVIEASKQSGRARLMDLDDPIDWTEFVQEVATPLGSRWIAHPGASGPGPDRPARLADGLVVAVGPEGGWTDAEVGEATGAGFRPIGLGPTTLRVETAALVGCASVLARLREDDR